MRNEITKAMSQKLDSTWIKTLTIPGRPQLSYVPIDKTIKFLNDHFGDNVSIEITKSEWLPTTNPSVCITVAMTIWTDDKAEVGSIRYGVGSDIHKPGRSGNNPDPDKLVKTAYANAVKKAANMFGFACELWDESNAHDEPAPVNNTPQPQQVPAQTIPEQAAPQQAAPQQAAPPAQQAPAAATPAALSMDSKMKVSAFCQETGLAKADLEDFLKEHNPASQGNPASLCHGDEAANLEVFLNFVRTKLAAK